MSIGQLAKSSLVSNRHVQRQKIMSAQYVKHTPKLKSACGSRSGATKLSTKRLFIGKIRLLYLSVISHNLYETASIVKCSLQKIKETIFLHISNCMFGHDKNFSMRISSIYSAPNFACFWAVLMIRNPCFI